MNNNNYNPYEILFNYWWSTNIYILCATTDYMRKFK